MDGTGDGEIYSSAVIWLPFPVKLLGNAFDFGCFVLCWDCLHLSASSDLYQQRPLSPFPFVMCFAVKKMA